MNLSDVYYLLSEYSVYKIFLAILSLFISVLIKRKLNARKYKRLVSLLPIIAGIALNLLIAIILGRNENFGEVFKSGISTGSIATVIYTALYGLTNPLDDYEEVPLDTLIIEGLLAGYISDGNLNEVSTLLAQVLRDNKPENEEIEQLNIILKTHTDATDAETQMLAKIIHNVLSASE